MRTTVFLGCGHITSAIIAGLHRVRYKTHIVVHDRNPGKMRSFHRQFRVGTEPDLAKAVAKASLLILAVRPQDLASLLRAVREADASADRSYRSESATAAPVLVCSLAAGIPLIKLRSALPNRFRFARAMPSPSCRFGYGLTAVAFDISVRKFERKELSRLFGSLGRVIEITERNFDAFTATYSCCHGYKALAVLAQAAQKAGLSRSTALVAAAHALADGILAWRDCRLSVDELLQEAATPGGVAAKVMSTMDAHGYSLIVEKSLRAGIARARNVDQQPF